MDGLGHAQCMEGKAKLAKACDVLYRTYAHALKDQGSHWAPGSPMDLALSRTSGPLKGALNEGAVVAWLAFQSALNHLSALGRLIADDGIVPPLATLARGATEAASVAWYLLDFEVSDSERGRRFFNEMLSSLTEVRLGHDGTEEGASLDQDIRKAITDGQSLGFKLTTPRKNPEWNAPYFGDRPPRATRRVEDLLATADLGRVVYRSLSATAYATAHGLGQFLQPIGDEVDGSIPSVIALSPASAANNFVAAPLGITTAGNSVLSAFGLDRGPVARTTTLALSAWAAVGGLPPRTFAD